MNDVKIINDVANKILHFEDYEFSVSEEQVRDKIVDDFNNSQIHDSYYFEDSGIDILWNRDREVYLILKIDKTYDYARPNKLDWVMEDLTTKDLKDYIEDQDLYDIDYFTEQN